MWKFKYYEGVRQAQAQSSGKLPPLDFGLEDFNPKGFLQAAFARLASNAIGGVIWLLREVWPVLSIGPLVVVTRYSDVRAVLDDSDAFETPFGLEMTELGGGEPFVLGLEDTAHQDQTQTIISVLKSSDILGVVTRTDELARALIASSGGRIDVVKDFIIRIAAETCAEYLGIDVEEANDLADWTMAISLLLFADPFGSPRKRLLALHSAARYRAAIRRSIIKARERLRASGSAPDTLIGRLVAPQAGADPPLTDGKIIAIVIGLSTGFVPTTSVTATKILQVLLRRPEAWRSAVAAARDDRSRDLQDILLEAARLNPALSPGLWRYARRARTVGEGRGARLILRDSIILAAGPSALRDRRRFERPRAFLPERFRDPGTAAAADMVFGEGAHTCLGRHLAVAQLTAIFGVLLRQPGLRRCKGRTGRLASAGPFPRRLDMEFDPDPVTTPQSMIVISVPVPESADPVELERRIRALGKAPSAFRAELRATRVVHFASLSLIDAGDEHAVKRRLIFELNADGPPDEVIPLVVAHARWSLDPIFHHSLGSEPLEKLLARHALRLHARPWGATGLNFNGTPEFSVADIERQDRIARFARSAVDHFLQNHAWMGARPMLVLRYVRRLIRQDPELLALPRNPDTEELHRLLEEGGAFSNDLVRPSRRRLRLSEWTAPKEGNGLFRFFRSAQGRGLLAAFAAYVLLLCVIILVAVAPAAPRDWAGALLLALASGVVSAALGVAAAALSLAGLLRRQESRDRVDERYPDLQAVRAATAGENRPGYVQNHFMAVTPLKRGWLRRLTLALGLWSIKQLVTFSYRPGFVLDMGTIHYAKWFRLPGTGKLVFLSNYDGSWESYLEDFITRAHKGQTAAWSNGLGFPRTRYLIEDGARDGDRFKRWVRRQQVPTQFWFSRFPELTTEQIRKNALMLDGLARATTDSEARAWVGLFGSMQRPDYAIESEEVQALLFRGMRRLTHSTCALIKLPDAQPLELRAWLHALTGAPSTTDSSALYPELAVTFGDYPVAYGSGEDYVATFVGFSAAGLQKLGLSGGQNAEALEGFPAAFNIGMAGRARVLGDVGKSRPKKWSWSDGKQADVALYVYGKSTVRCEAVVAQHADMLGGPGVILHRVNTSPATTTTTGDPSLDFEHFGFRDGISQPVIQGTQRFAKNPLAADVVAPGEFILGYRSNQGYFPPSPTVDGDTDLFDDLPTAAAETPEPFPRFCPEGANVRDFGRNGSFLVIRELEQDVSGFNAFLNSAVEELTNTYANLAEIVGSEITTEWLAAKMMGRWRTGESLIDKPSTGTLQGILPVKTPRIALTWRNALTAGNALVRRKRDGWRALVVRRATRAMRNNNFAYGVDDPRGLICPLGAHVRRANPRDGLHPGDPRARTIVNRHRLLRRGRAYESKAGKGLLFACLCADLERQFEFVQQTWIGSPVFHGLQDEPDPILGQGGRATRVFTIPTPAGAIKLRNVTSHVTVRGGGYFFMPSRSSLRYLHRRTMGDSGTWTPTPL